MKAESGFESSQASVLTRALADPLDQPEALELTQRLDDHRFRQPVAFVRSFVSLAIPSRRLA
jgi:hypothetical protein